MRLEWINNRVIAAAAVLSFSCVAAAAYTVVQEKGAPQTRTVSESGKYGFVYSMLDAEASLYDIPAAKTQQAKQGLKNFYQQAAVNLTAPKSLAEADLRQFALHADKLIKTSFSATREVLSVTESLLQNKGSQSLNTWLLLSTAQQFDVEASLSPKQDHAHVVFKTEEGQWLEWKVDHLQDMQAVEFKALDGYDLWTAVDLSLVQHYVVTGMQSNDESIEALAKSAVEDNYGVQAAALYSEFLASRGRDVALLTH